MQYNSIISPTHTLHRADLPAPDLGDVPQPGTPTRTAPRRSHSRSKSGTDSVTYLK